MIKSLIRLMSTIDFGVKPSANEYAIMYHGWSGGKEYLKAHSHFAKPRGFIAKPSTSHILVKTRNHYYRYLWPCQGTNFKAIGCPVAKIQLEMHSTYVTRWAKTRHIPHFEKIELRPRIMTATFDLAAERISKRSVVELLRYSLKRTPHTRNYFSCKCNFWRC